MIFLSSSLLIKELVSFSDKPPEIFICDIGPIIYLSLFRELTAV
ncbi:hypothetical protein YPPY66_0191 [Yersinia pestis PY-66]|nr:hypothetical protein YpK1973002_1875 [Yersinia pestis biovar Mediaevalis str. K1973002]EEO78842.1 hypothetical protein YPF_4768 [Yersinia pestis biovar Orientalis str. India 195]EEO88198.1 hypothetical protein YPS_4731 [Yersinia pestis Pestoides A]EIQ96593.1 hypothetical protein YPPY02_4700 [Yersinia pestis PY-02]EIQ97188.1 hypothetical protein YPPY05_4794 [Yersinia pestis PY-05]EIR11891.1 hypothetical protein YPPY06_4971 [Yersinia pestis PY-06]EIR24050.1 hypothetical protein YPPY07_4917 [